MVKPNTFTLAHDGLEAKAVLAEYADGSGSYSFALFDDEPPYPQDNFLAVGDVTWARYLIDGVPFDVPVIDLGSAQHGSMDECKRAGRKEYLHVVHHFNSACIEDHEGFYNVRGATTLKRSSDGAFAFNVYDEEVEFVTAAPKRQDLEEDS